MNKKVKGNAGEFLIKNSSTILELKVDENGNKTGESLVHIISDSIEDQYDRNLVNEKLVEFQLNKIMS
ncbi:MAG: hypothetical protein H6613_10485 [Ignavibacteriales bacterium]|nr:hypothetical protein [Ignavibacteriota bacterium]MCB9248927.1 hypothetical protein [Ignavibacteriales bacterium]